MPEPLQSKSMPAPIGRDVIVVHSSDLHVDSSPAPEDCASGVDNLARVLATAQRLAADLVLLAGDTFDSHRQPPALVSLVADMIAAASAPVVILPGNHDPIVSGAVYHHMLALRCGNLHVLGVTHSEAIVFEDLDLEVWGRAHRDYGDMAPLERVRTRSTRWQIAMAHGHYEPQPDRSTHLRASWLIGDGELAATGSDYVALGHWNRAADVGNGNIRAHYSGSPDYAGTVNVIRLTRAGEVLVEREPALVTSRL